jgi:hypothetical protein
MAPAKPRESKRSRAPLSQDRTNAERNFPRYDIKTVSRGESGYAAFLIDHDTGDSWVFDVDLSWKKIRRSAQAARPKNAPSRKR